MRTISFPTSPERSGPCAIRQSHDLTASPRPGETERTGSGSLDFSTGGVVPTSSVIREHLGRLLSWEDAHTSFDSAVSGLPDSLRGTQPAGLPYSPWQLVEHLRITQKDIWNSAPIRSTSSS